MGWAIGYDNQWKRDIGYGVPAECDHPKCKKRIDRGLAYVCADEQPYGGEFGCGLYFCEKHAGYTDKHSQVCERCAQNDSLPEDAPYEAYGMPFDPKPDIPKWLRWKLKHHSWQEWRDNHPDQVRDIIERLKPRSAEGPLSTPPTNKKGAL